MKIRKNYIDDDYESLEFVFKDITPSDAVTTVSLYFEEQIDNDNDVDVSMSLVLLKDGANVGQIDESLSRKQLDLLISHLSNIRDNIIKNNNSLTGKVKNINTDGNSNITLMAKVEKTNEALMRKNDSMFEHNKRR